MSIVGDLKDVLTKLIARMEQMHHPEWTAHILELKEKYPLKYDDSQLSCPYIIEELDRITKGNAIITTDVDSIRCGRRSIIIIRSPARFVLRRSWHDGLRYRGMHRRENRLPGQNLR